MTNIPLTIISDPYYVKSSWFQDTLSGIRSIYSSYRYQQEIIIHSESVDNLDTQSLPPVVIVTNGSLAFVQSTVKTLLRAKKYVILSGLHLNNYDSDLISNVTADRKTAMEHLVKYLIDCGRTKLSLFGFWTKSINDMIFYQSALAASHRFGAPIDAKSVYLWDKQLSECLPLFTENITSYDAAICPNDTIALCLINLCIKLGIKIPESLYITGASNMQIGRFCKPSLTTIATDSKILGKEVCNTWHFICTHLQNPHSINVMVPNKIIVRDSTENKPCIPYTEIDGIIETDLSCTPNQFFTDPLINALMRIENCLYQCDDLDIKIINCIMQGKSYESISEELFISISAIRYRRNKIFKDADVNTRLAFENLLRDNLLKL